MPPASARAVGLESEYAGDLYTLMECCPRSQISIEALGFQWQKHIS